MPIVSARTDFNKRHTPQEQAARRDAALLALSRLYCDVIRSWRACSKKRCKRHRRCCGEPWPCLQRAKAKVPRGMHPRILAAVRAGGPARRAPINSIEARMRRDPPGWLT